DLRVIQDNYAAMKKWMNYMQERYTDDRGLINKDSYGDWCFPPVSIDSGRGKIADKKYPNPLISASYYYHLLNLMSKFSGLLNIDADRTEFLMKAAALRSNYNKAYYQNDGFYGGNTLTENLLSLYFGLVEDNGRSSLNERILEIIEKENNGHLSIGVIGTQWLLRSLTEMGRADVAYKLATNRTYPAWGYMLENGATTIWELWNGNTAHPKMNSQNHVMMLGDLLVWYYEDLAGIKSAKPGFQEIEMYPQFIDGLDFVEARYKSLSGEIYSNWKKDKKNLNWEIEIPAGSQAYVYLPTGDRNDVEVDGKALRDMPELTLLGMERDRLKLVVGSGRYQFKVKR